MDNDCPPIDEVVVSWTIAHEIKYFSLLMDNLKIPWTILKFGGHTLLACNPKGKYNSNEPLTINLGIPSPLLSRFDVVLLLLDTPNNKWDNEAAAFLLGDTDFTNKFNIQLSFIRIKHLHFS